jgi:hypothetical protein
MASEAERVSKKISWVRKFFDVEEKNITENSGGLQVQIYDVCNLPALGNSDDIKCGKCYKHSPKNGTKTLQRHVIEKHGHLEKVKEEMKNRRVSNQVKNILISVLYFLRIFFFLRVAIA